MKDDKRKLKVNTVSGENKPEEPLDFSKQEIDGNENLANNKQKRNIKFLFWVLSFALVHIVCMFLLPNPFWMYVLGLIIFQLIALTRIGEIYSIPTVNLILELLVKLFNKK